MISIALATYNGEKYLAEQIESIINQTYKNFELIIRDDCSSDGTIDILNKYREKDNRIKIFFNDKNKGFKKNFEILINDCKGRYIAFADQDDIWTSDHLEILINSIGDKDVCCANSLLVDKNNDSLNFTMNDVIGMDFPPSNGKEYIRLCYSNYVQGSTMLIKNDFAKANIPVPPQIEFHDYWFALIGSLNNGIAYSPKIITRYRQHGKNVTTNKKYSVLREIYNYFNGFNINHIKEQIIIMDYLLQLYPDDNRIIEIKSFFENICDNKITKKQLIFFKNNYNNLFLTRKYYYVRKLFFLKFLNVNHSYNE